MRSNFATGSGNLAFARGVSLALTLSMRGEQVQGIASADYWVPSTGAGDPGLPPNVVGLLQRYRLPTV